MGNLAWTNLQNVMIMLQYIFSEVLVLISEHLSYFRVLLFQSTFIFRALLFSERFYFPSAFIFRARRPRRVHSKKEEHNCSVVGTRSKEEEWR
jgi:hypothetical protein